MPHLRHTLGLACLLASPLVFAGGPSLAPVGPEEIGRFKAMLEGLQPGTSNVGNVWIYGKPGQQTEAMGDMYALSHDRAILDRMIVFADAAMSERNDLAPAPVGQRVLWTGAISPVWPNRPSSDPDAGYSATENGDIVGHIGYCALLILKSPELADRAVPDGDPHHFGKTYRERARTYVKLLDQTCDQFMVPWLVRASDQDRFYFTTTEAYRKLSAISKAGQMVPWNQQFMMDNGFQRLAECHEVLGDDPARVARYDRYVSHSIAWMLTTVVRQADPKNGGTYYLWKYAIEEAKHIEDSNHTDIDLEGLYRSYLSGRYAAVLSRADMEAFANDNVDVMSLGGGKWAGHVDGHSDPKGHGSGTSYPRPNFLSVLEFRPDAYAYFAGCVDADGHGSDPVEYARLLWIRNRIATGAQP